MTHSTDRQERSRQRSIEHQRKRRNTYIVFAVALFFYVGVPILWYGAIEYGWVHAPETTEFKSSLDKAKPILFLVVLYSTIRFLEYQLEERKEKRKAQTAAREEFAK